MVSRRLRRAAILLYLSDILGLSLRTICLSGTWLTLHRFNTFQSNLLAIPSTVAGMITNFGITLVSEAVNDRSFVAMAEDIWTLPFLVAIYCLPDSPNQWLFFVRSPSMRIRSFNQARNCRDWRRAYYHIRTLERFNSLGRH